MTKDSYIMRCRPYGNDWGQCAWCGEGPEDMFVNFSAFVNTYDIALVPDFFRDNGLVVRADIGRADEGRYQIKVMACTKHVINLRLLRELIIVNESRVTEQIIKFTIY